MTTVSKPKSGYEKWQDDIDWAVPDATRETLTTVAGGAYEKSSAF